MSTVTGYAAIYALVIAGLCCEWRQAEGIDRVAIGALIASLAGSPLAGWLAHLTR